MLPGARIGLLLVALVLLPPVAAHGHADTGGSSAQPGTTGRVEIAIAHGCGGEAGALEKVDRVAVLVPPQFGSVRGVTVPGWTVTGTPGPKGTRVEWRARRGGAEAPTFALRVRYPTRAGTYLLPTVQYCGADSIAWIQRGADAERPAPTVIVR